MFDLAQAYVHRGAFSPASMDDATHVAAAAIGNFDIIVSWNFKHLVNRRRRAMVAAVNIDLGFPSIEILAPPEV
ncbi:MAG: hypothetical protein AAB353_06260 [Candidatus Hydrogenedentota bacterium]